jgi:hypothetical protein
MCVACENYVQTKWRELLVGQQFRTPDNLNGEPFHISNIDPTAIRIEPQAIGIAREAFIDTIHHLQQNGYFTGNPCAIGSSNTPAQSGPLCTASRQANDNVRCINYILPILADWGKVGIDGTRPNRTWLR